MKKILSPFVILVIVAVYASLALAKIEVPDRTNSWVNDYAGIIDGETKIYLEKLASSIKQKTPEPVELIIATFKSLEGWNFSDFAREYGEKWRLIKQGKRDNGVILLIAFEERRIGIGVGRNLNGILTPAKQNDIIYNFIAPEFQKGNYSEGIKKGAEAIVAVLNEADIPTGNMTVYVWVGVLLVIIAIFTFLLRNIYSRQH